jgi:hypothetical protein
LPISEPVLPVDVVLDEHAVLEHCDLGARGDLADDHDPLDRLPACQELGLADDRHPPPTGFPALAAPLLSPRAGSRPLTDATSESARRGSRSRTTVRSDRPAPAPRPSALPRRRRRGGGANRCRFGCVARLSGSSSGPDFRSAADSPSESARRAFGIGAGLLAVTSARAPAAATWRRATAPALAELLDFSTISTSSRWPAVSAAAACFFAAFAVLRVCFDAVFGAASVGCFGAAFAAAFCPPFASPGGAFSDSRPGRASQSLRSCLGLRRAVGGLIGRGPLAPAADARWLLRLAVGVPVRRPELQHRRLERHARDAADLGDGFRNGMRTRLGRPLAGRPGLTSRGGFSRGGLLAGSSPLCGDCGVDGHCGIGSRGGLGGSCGLGGSRAGRKVLFRASGAPAVGSAAGSAAGLAGQPVRPRPLRRATGRWPARAAFGRCGGFGGVFCSVAAGAWRLTSLVFEHPGIPSRPGA